MADRTMDGRKVHSFSSFPSNHAMFIGISNRNSSEQYAAASGLWKRPCEFVPHGESYTITLPSSSSYEQSLPRMSCLVNGSGVSDEPNIRRPADLEVQAMNVSHILYICQVLLQNDHFYHYKTLRRRISALIGPPGTGNTNAIM